MPPFKMREHLWHLPPGAHTLTIFRPKTSNSLKGRKDFNLCPPMGIGLKFVCPEAYIATVSTLMCNFVCVDFSFNTLQK